LLKLGERLLAQDSRGSRHPELARHPETRVWCVLNRGTVEEVMFDTVATKQDAADLCLRGRRLPRDYQPMDLSEVLYQSRLRRELEQEQQTRRRFGVAGDGGEVAGGAGATTLAELHRDEALCAAAWPGQLSELTQLAQAPAWAWAAAA